MELPTMSAVRRPITDDSVLNYAPTSAFREVENLDFTERSGA
ncbi:hypothetical protein PC116_g12835 [Phytophthora cactorum]|uniref:Uncharacterized protein n=1 Tax=Phytophthora cactorum TaxID=29920 RepID=A0A8T1KUR9_9STRA|nr:hypothetical protein PC114_g19501 [Phytophthora cactorum]KAG2891009.1 hypothetical protein PC117_g24344 [Phytophthora cactorum]KAG3004816.1 hypothetical protein PC120_g18327 [Phytophthora cactorum]KAG3019628.1 hypothetical protein PC119_g10241 [Phytophthora cactorum]KAG3171207.1 hypothetical protein C6341_g10585 [Phytophthora cactorum]